MLGEKILVLGGTRFIGRALVSELVKSSEFCITVSSRRQLELDKKRVSNIVCERRNLPILVDSLDSYDYVFDFTAYKPEHIYELPKGWPKRRYFMISTEWISQIQQIPAREFGEVDSSYIKNKALAEEIVCHRFREAATIIRLPPVLGKQDHHKRLNYYLNRIKQIKRVITLEDKVNRPFLWSLDFSRQMVSRLTSKTDFLNFHKLVPTTRVTHSSFLKSLAAYFEIPIQLRTMSVEQIREFFPNTLKADLILHEVESAQKIPNLWNQTCMVGLEENLKDVDLLAKLAMTELQQSAINEESRNEPRYS